MVTDREAESEAATQGDGTARGDAREIVYGIFVATLGGAILILLPSQTRDDSAAISLDNPALLPSFYPRAVGLLILATGLWILARGLVTLVSVRRGVARRVMDRDDGLSSFEPRATLNTPVVVLAMAVYAVLVNTLGFRSAVIIMGIVGARWIGAPWWAAVLIAVVPAIGLFAIFSVWLGVPLPAHVY